MMKFSNLFIKTYRDNQKDADVQSYNLMLRAGYIRQLASGIYSYLNFGLKSLKKIENILREELNEIGGDELCMPIVHPAEVWQKTNRWYDIDSSLVRFKDRNDRDMVLAMTHEEIVSHLASNEIDSYRQLPKLVYQIYTKFRDEPRSRGGLIRVREFTMKDSYSLDKDIVGLEKQYTTHYNTYFRIFARIGLPAIAVQSDTGMMGGKVAHEFMYITPIGEDTIFICKNCGYKANKEVATIRRIFTKIESNIFSKIHTPKKRTIPELAAYLEIKEESFAKVILFSSIINGEKKLIMAMVRGDTEANPTKIQKLCSADNMKLAEESDFLAIGAVPGFASPIGIDKSKCIVVVDEYIERTNNLVIGANENDYHYINACYDRDFTADFVGDIISAYDGAFCPISISDECTLKSVKGIEIGNIFQLGTKYTEALGAYFTDDKGQKSPIVMGSYGIGVGRLLACLCEEYNDAKGLYLPISVAPYHVIIIALMDIPEVEVSALKLYERLKSEGIDVIYDDRTSDIATTGVKFSDADLIGIPIRITISKRSLFSGGFEIKLRNESDHIIIKEENSVQIIKDKINFLFEQVNKKFSLVEKWDINKS